MTPEAALIELLDRVTALQGEMGLINTDELEQWPINAVEAIKAYNLIRKTRPATSVICNECEEECVRPVQTILVPSAKPALFLVCEKRDDINRIPVATGRIEQWQTSGTLVADFLSKLLGLRRPATDNATAERWEIGMLKGTKHSSHLVLLASDNLNLTFAGHSLPLTDILGIENNQFTIDKRTLTRLVDKPLAGAGDVESATQRRERLKKRVQEVKTKGTRAFLKVVAEEEGISVSRLKQLIKDDSKPGKPSFMW